MVFNHSVKVPTQYKRTATILKKALDGDKSLKNLLYQEDHVRKQSSQAVLKLYANNRSAIDEAIDRVKIIEENPRLCPTLCKVLVTELIYGRKDLVGDSKPVQTIRSYLHKLQEALESPSNTTGAGVSAKKDLQLYRYVRVNSNLCTMSEAKEMLALNQWRHKEFSIFNSYNEYLEALMSLEEDEYMIDMHVPDLLVFHPKKRHYWACHKYVKEKKFLLQDKGTALVVELFAPPPGAKVLDMCAAPGMKTIHMTNKMRNHGKIYSFERSNERYKTFCEMVIAAGCKIIKTKNKDVLSIDLNKAQNFEYVLVDPSCSSSGIQNRISLSEEKKQPGRLDKLAGFQIKLLTLAMQLPKVKRIAYCTCSIYPEENEEVIQRCLELNPQFKLLNCRKALMNKWPPTEELNYKGISKYCIHTKPERDHADGIFIAILKRITDDAE